jgi:WXXGXW repeat (2 copies)
MLKSFKYAAAFAVALSAIAPSALAQSVVPEIIVNVAPPPPQVEVRTVQPSPQSLWIGGHWAWRGGQHVWIRGHWAEPPNAGMVWEPAHWSQRGGAWVFVEGHWRWSAPPQPVVWTPPVAPAQPVYIQTQPPPVINEVIAAAPFANAVWIPGYWHWNGFNHVWLAGHWSAPRAGWRWEADRWTQGPQGWYRVPGHWRQ